MKETIAAIRARRVFDSRGRPTLEVDVALEGGALGLAIAPAGASRGKREAIDLRDGGNRFGGFDVMTAAARVRDEIAPALVGHPADDQAGIDSRLVALDGTPNKARLGGNAMIATSMAAAKACAVARGKPLWKFLADGLLARRPQCPLPEIQIFGGGAHAARRVDVQDFMVIATGAATFADALEMTAGVYAAAGALMSEAGKLAGVADEGGFWPAFESNEQALAMLARAIEKAGFRPIEDVAISLDVAASEFYDGENYRLARDGRRLGSEELADLLISWARKYPIVSIEDPLAEDDEVGFAAFTRVAAGLQVVCDDYVVTNAGLVRRAQAVGAGNAALIKPNQAGTLTETLAALEAAHAGGWGAIVSARSGETEDVTIAHLAVGWGVKQLKVGSFTRSERMAKWNEGLRIAEDLGDGGALPPRSAFPWGDRAWAAST
jgi:enolase